MPRNTKRNKRKRKGGTKRGYEDLEWESDEPYFSVSAKHARESVEHELPPYLKTLDENILAPLDLVDSSYWFKNNDVDIFLIGEQHGEKHGRCTGILDMFKSLISGIRKNKRQATTPFPLVNIMLESNPYEFKTSDEIEEFEESNPEFKKVDQLTSVINYLPSRADIFRVHWFDANQSKDLLHHEQENCAINKSKCEYNKLPSWIDLLQKAGFDYDTIEDSQDTFTPYINIPRRYDQITSKNVSSWKSIIRRHCLIKKQLCKIKKINDDYVDPNKIFNEDYVVGKFHKKNISTCITYNASLKNREFPTDHPLSIALRHAIDFYCVARIISQRMKCVVIYGGHEHILFIIEILTDMGYNLIKKTTYDCP